MLSGGERRRLALALVVASGANLLDPRRADEPPRPGEPRGARGRARGVPGHGPARLARPRAARRGRRADARDRGRHIRAYDGGWAEMLRRREEREAPPPPTGAQAEAGAAGAAAAGGGRASSSGSRQEIAACEAEVAGARGEARRGLGQRRDAPGARRPARGAARADRALGGALRAGRRLEALLEAATQPAREYTPSRCRRAGRTVETERGGRRSPVSSIPA